MKPSDIFHKDFKLEPYWWEEFRPSTGDGDSPPQRIDVAIIGGGFTGLACAVELAEAGISSVVLDAKKLGEGASTRNFGSIGLGTIKTGKTFTGKILTYPPETTRALAAAGAESFALVEELIRREDIGCFWEKRGRFSGAWSHKAYRTLSRVAENAKDPQNLYMIPPERQHEELASDYYFGGMIDERQATLHPALFYKGMLDAARRRQIPVYSDTPATRIAAFNGGWIVETPRGSIQADKVVIATNGYTGDVTKQLKRRLIPVTPHVVVTEELPPELVNLISPKGRIISSYKRVGEYFRISHDRKRLIIGGRPRFTNVGPEVTGPIFLSFVHRMFPQFKGVRLAYDWSGSVAFTFDALPHMGVMDGLYYAVGCNGSGVARMTLLGHRTAQKIAGHGYPDCGFELPDFPDMNFYSGDPSWALPVIGSYYRLRDRMERTFSRRRPSA